MPKPSVLLTGATGFVGKRLYPVLRAQGYRVVCCSRDPEQARARFPDREFRRFDLTLPHTLETAMEGCTVALYLVHAMAGQSRDYGRVEEQGARAFLRAAQAVGVKRIVYLGGMRPTHDPSRHLQSRLNTGAILRSGRISTIELQASMIIGSESESFRMVRDLSARLPVMVLPAWANSRTQPVAIDDVVEALRHALDEPLQLRGAFGLPGPETLSAREILMRTAKLMGRDPKAFGVPLVTPYLSSFWIRLVTRAHPRIARELVEGLRSDIVHRGPGYWARMPHHELLGFDDAARGALYEDSKQLTTKSRLIERFIRVLSPRANHGHP